MARIATRLVTTRRLVVLLATAGVVVAGTVWISGAPRRQRNAAVLDARSGRFGAAEPNLVRWLEQHPDDPEVLEAIARGRIVDRRDTDAESPLNRLVDIKPSDLAIRRLRFELNRRQKYRELAFADGAFLLEKRPEDPELKHAVMQLAFSTGHFDVAMKLCDELLQEAPRSRELRTFLAEINRSLGNEQAAERGLDELVREDPDAFGPKLSRGILLDSMGRTDEAIPLLRDVFERDPSRRRTSGYQLGLALSKVGKSEDAEKVMREVQRLQDAEVFRDALLNRPDDLDLRLRLAKTLLRDGHTDEGIKLIESILTSMPAHQAANQALAEHYEKQGNHAAAARHRKKLNPAR